MTRDEWDAWVAHTEKSKTRWMIDEIRQYNNGEYLFYKGGQAGTFIWIHTDGVVWVGTYKYALPHIGDAEFTIQHNKKVADNVEDAAKYVLERMGLPFLLNLTCGVNIR